MVMSPGVVGGGPGAHVAQHRNSLSCSTAQELGEQLTVGSSPWGHVAVHSNGQCHTPSIAFRQLPELVTPLKGQTKLLALVYDILPSTTAVFSYAIGSRKLSANEQLFCWCSNSSTFVTNNSNKTRPVIYSRQQSLHQHK